MREHSAAASADGLSPGDLDDRAFIGLFISKLAELTKQLTCERAEGTAYLEPASKLQRVFDILQTQQRGKDHIAILTLCDATGVADDLRARRLAGRERPGDRSEIEADLLRDRHRFRGGCDLHSAEHVHQQFIGSAGANGAEVNDVL